VPGVNRRCREPGMGVDDHRQSTPWHRVPELTEDARHVRAILTISVFDILLRS
jgi:hypothetical protein